VATATTDLTYISFPIVKFEKNEDGDLVVYGKATDGSVDSDEQIVDPDWSAKALTAWHGTDGGNVRVQHQAMRDPAGKSIGIELDRDGDSGHWVKSLVVEPVAKRLVEKGILTAYSVGIARPVIRRDPTGKARGGIVAGGSLAEISLVDRPANKSCGLVMAKSQGGTTALEGVSEVWGDQEFLAKYATDDVLNKSGGDPMVPGKKPSASDTAAPADEQSTADDGQDGQDGDGGDDAQDQDDTDSEDAVSKAGEATQKAYHAERKEWLTREPNLSKALGGTEYLQRRADWMRWNAEGDDTGLTGTREGSLVWLAKRGIDPNASEKRDFSQAQRDQAAGSGAAMPDGSFPIKTAEDLGNAIHLAGHAKDPAAARTHIKERARALGLESKIPDSWKTENGEPTVPDALAEILGKGLVTEQEARLMLAGDAWDAAVKADGAPGGNDMDGNNGVDAKAAASGDADKPAGKPCPTCKGDGKIMGDQRKCPDCNGTGQLTGNAGKGTDLPVTVKGSKDCTGCGKTYDADAKVRNCEGCGKDLPNADKAEAVVKGSRDCGSCGMGYDSDHTGKFCSKCGSKLPKLGKARKAEKASADADGHAEAEMLADPQLAALASTVAKSVQIGLITEAAGDEIIATAAKARRKRSGGLPADTHPAGTHREPDGSSTVERLEPQAGMPTSPDKTPDKVPVSVAGLGEGMTGQKPPGRKGAGPTYTIGRMHDALCAAYSAPDVLDTYPSLKTVGDGVDEGWLAGQMTAAAQTGKAKRTARMAALVDAAATLKGMDPSALDDARAELHKSFTDMYPNLKITPRMGIRPGSYQRPYLSSGHAAEDAGHNGADKIPPSAHVPEPEQFRRPLMTDGHESDSPANKAGDIRTEAPVRTGASRVFYSNAQREAARVAMQAIHDHISGNFPDMCPMASSKSVLPPDMGAKNVPMPTVPHTDAGVGPAVKAVEGDLAAQASQLIADAIKRHGERQNPAFMTGQELEKAATAQGYTLVKAEAPPAAPAGLTAEQIKSLITQTFDPYADRLTELQKQLDDVAGRPDPAMAPVRGAMAATPSTLAVPVERRSLVDDAASAAAKARDAAAADEQTRYRQYIDTLTKSPDPSVRERAITVLNKLDGA
jgi:hypothetical protein